MAKPPIAVIKLGNSGEFLARIKGIGGIATYVGIPASSSADRSLKASKRAANTYSPRKSRQKFKNKLNKIASSNTPTNAQLLYWFSKGSPLRGQPARPVIEAAIHAPGNKERISALVAKSIEADLNGRHYESKKYLIQAGTLAAKLSREWFLDPRNGWAPNAYSTLLKKQGEDPGIDTGIMRMAITHVEKETQ